MKRFNYGFFHLVFFLISLLLLGSGLSMDPFSYEQSLKSECVMEPPQTTSNTEGEGFEELKINEKRGNIKVVERVDLQKGNTYSISASVKLRNDTQRKVGMTLRWKNGKNVFGGEVMAKKACWSLLKGGITADFSGPIHIFFESNDLAAAEIHVQNVRMQRFNKTQWRLQQDQLIEKIRKNKVRFQLSFHNKSTVKGSVIYIEQIKPSFLLGCAMNYRILESQTYKEWFVSRFRLTSFTNEMKWYTTEVVRGQENYTLADSMMNLAEENNVMVKGHTVLWDDQRWQPSWVKRIRNPEDLKNVTLNRINSVMKRYKGRLIAWDVMNENVHFSYFEYMLGGNASAIVYSMASKLEPDIPLFLNEFNTVEYDNERVGSPVNVKKRMEEIVSYPGNKNIKGGIGAQAHFAPKQPNLAYMRSALDTLGSLGFPVWLTEVDMAKCPNQVKYMEEILREAYSHPAVKGIIIYAGPEVSGFNKLTLADKDFNNTEAGDLIDKLLQEWQQEPVEISIQNHEHNDEEGRIVGFSPEISLSHGHYKVTVTNPSMKNLSTSFNLEITKEMGHLQEVQLVIDA
ncbi:Endo-1,4-beta-xylanase 4 [Cardamine amara subsp. amara]|uniref:Endo-1,4-beta-xylanase 4 n=1 Tax=Cardamine amara subsp. amara TaxID=228776 RepID=A0ABD1AZM2_CARAN